MYRYVINNFKSRVRTVCHQNLSVKQNDKHENKSLLKSQEVQFFPSEQKRRRYDDNEFKKKYNCKHPNSYNNNILQAITWVSHWCYMGFFESNIIHYSPLR